MKKISVSHIRRWLVLFLVMVVLTTMATYLLVYVEISRTLTSQPPIVGSETGPGIHENGHSPLSGLKIRLFLIGSGAIVAIWLLGYLWIEMATRQLNRPLRIISKAIAGMARGKLNATVTIDAEEEFAQIANSINELAANLQELLLFVWKHSGQCLEQLERLEADTAGADNGRIPEAHLNRIHQMIKSVDDLRKMAKAYVFYDVHLEGENTVSISKPGHVMSSEIEKSLPNNN